MVQHMNWDAIGAVAELVGAIAVVMTLLYLAVQIRQSNRLSRFQSARDVFEQINDNNRLVVENQDLRMLASKNFDSLKNEESKQLSVFVARQLNAFTNLQTAYDQGLIDEALFMAGKDGVGVFISDWPNIQPILVNWAQNFPTLLEKEIFEELRENVRVDA